MIGDTSVEEVEDEPLFCARVAGIDIAKAFVMVTVRVPGHGKRRLQETREYKTTRKDLLALADWLRTWQVERVGMEATGDYWKPVYFLLEQQGLDCDLYPAAQVKALPGRPKTDKLDSVWLAKITERGSLRSSFVPPEPIRRLRACTRYRRNLTRMVTAEKQRAEKVLEDAHLKLSSVISDIHGVSGRAMLEAIIAGERDPKVLAQLARGRMRVKIRELEQALDCSFVSSEHAFVLAMMLANIDHLTAQIEQLSQQIDVLCEPYRHQIARLDAVPGTGIITAQDVIAEIGTDMTVFPTSGHLASWARRGPQVSASGGRRTGSNAAGKGDPYLGAALGEAAIAASRTDSFVGERHRRLCKRMPKKKAQQATTRHLLVLYYELLSDPEAVYTDLGSDYYQRRANVRREIRNNVRAIERRGYRVILEPTAPETEALDLNLTQAS
jgi:transposase